MLQAALHLYQVQIRFNDGLVKVGIGYVAYSSTSKKLLTCAFILGIRKK